MSDITFAGFGALRELEMMEALTGRIDIAGPMATLFGLELGVQRVSDLPSQPIDSSSPDLITPQSVLQQSLGPDARSYVAKVKPGSTILGRLFRVSIAEMTLLDEWEMVSLGWHRRKQIGVFSRHTPRWGVRAVTHVIDDEQCMTTEGVNGMNYNSYLIDQELLLDRADQFRRGFNPPKS